MLTHKKEKKKSSLKMSLISNPPNQVKAKAEDKVIMK